MSFTMGDDNSSVEEECIRDGNLVLSALYVNFFCGQFC